MSDADREQTRRDAERFTSLDDARLIHLEDAEQIVSVMAALLAELGQAEERIREADALLADPSGSPIDAINLARKALKIR